MRDPIKKPMTILAFDYGTRRVGVAVGNTGRRADNGAPVRGSRAELRAVNTGSPVAALASVASAGTGGVT